MSDDNRFSRFLDDATAATAVATKPEPVIPEGPATLKVLESEWVAGQYELSVCAWSEQHTDDGRCPFDLGRRGYTPRLVLAPQGPDALLVPESPEDLEAYALHRVQGEADILVARVRREGV